MPTDAQQALIGEYCLTCHDNDKEKGGLTLEEFDPARAHENGEIAEKMIRKLRAGMMPPAGAERPDAATIDALASALETQLDQFALSRPNPGRRTFQRLNRAEYTRSIRDLLGIEADVSTFLPPDTLSHNFDNISDVQSLSPTVLEGYLRAASRISGDAIGDPDAAPGSTTYKVPRTASQLTHIDGAPFGTRGESTRGQSAVMFAVAANRIDALKLFIANGADLTATTKVVDLTGQTNPDEEEFLRVQRQGGAEAAVTPSLTPRAGRPLQLLRAGRLPHNPRHQAAAAAGPAAAGEPADLTWPASQGSSVSRSS